MPRSFWGVFLRIIVYGVFIITAAVLVFFARGYRYDQVDHQVKSTGMALLDGKYDRLVLSLDGVQVGNVLPAKILSIQPGFHRIEITKEGFLPWSLSVLIEDGMVYSVPFVMLVQREDVAHPTHLAMTSYALSDDARLVAASPQAFIFLDRQKYIYIDRTRRTRRFLSVPSGLSNISFFLSNNQGYGFRDGEIVTFPLSDGIISKALSLRSHSFPYDISTLSFLQSSLGFSELLFFRDHEVRRMRLDTDTPRLVTRFADTLYGLAWFRDMDHTVVHLADRLQFCDTSFQNCYLLSNMTPKDSFATDQTSVYRYDAQTKSVDVYRVFNVEKTFLSYIFSETELL